MLPGIRIRRSNFFRFGRTISLPWPGPITIKRFGLRSYGTSPKIAQPTIFHPLRTFYDSRLFFFSLTCGYTLLCFLVLPSDSQRHTEDSSEIFARMAMDEAQNIVLLHAMSWDMRDFGKTGISPGHDQFEVIHKDLLFTEMKLVEGFLLFSNHFDSPRSGWIVPKEIWRLLRGVGKQDAMTVFSAACEEIMSIFQSSHQQKWNNIETVARIRNIFVGAILEALQIDKTTRLYSLPPLIEGLREARREDVKEKEGEKAHYGVIG